MAFSCPPPHTIQEDIEHYYTVDNYRAEEEDEISFKKGVVVDVLKKSLNGWWVVKLDSIMGLAPATFLKKIENQEQVEAAQVSLQLRNTFYS